MKIFLFALMVATVGFGVPLAAQDNPVVVELYTSQGCSSCPPADALMHELAERDDVIPLALHVDYWDYIGWKDPFGSPAHAKRQRAYAAAGSRRTIYTPEMIVGGVTDIVGARPMALSKAIAEHSRMDAKVSLDVTRDGNTLTVLAKPLAAGIGQMTVHMLRYTPKTTTVIKRGENRGRTLDYSNVVEGWAVLTEWDGMGPLDVTVSIKGDKPTVVIIQQDTVGPILAAARVR